MLTTRITAAPFDVTWLCGACHIQGAPCYSVSSGANGHSRYDMPSAIIARIQALQPGQWFTLQAYILVTGSSPGY